MGKRTLLCIAISGWGCGGDDDGGASTSTSDGGGSTTSGQTSDPPGTGSAPGDDGESTAPAGTSDDGGPSTGDSGADPSSDGAVDSTTGTTACRGMTFFATSSGSGGLGGNLGGLAGADAMCQAHAELAGQGACTWHAYLSTADEDARDRIGAGPWFNAAGEMIAADVASLHTEGLSNGEPQHVLDESGAEVPSNEHDILTGSLEDGTLMAGATCADWTSDSTDDIARVGHSDIPQNPEFSPSWNSAHDSAGCSESDLDSTGGAGRLYCFAID